MRESYITGHLNFILSNGDTNAHFGKDKEEINTGDYTQMLACIIKKGMSYTFFEHLHNYSVWTAARAVQRGFTTTKNIMAAIDKTELSNLAKNGDIKTPSEFDSFHRRTSEILIEHFSNLGIPISYGRAAKIIAVYLKTSIIIRDSGESHLAKIIHPPIDNILLTNLSKKNRELEISNVRWTQLTANEYFELINKLRSIHCERFWELEKFWTPIQD